MSVDLAGVILSMTKNNKPTMLQLLSRYFVAIATVMFLLGISTSIHAAEIRRTKDFDKFWIQLRSAFLKEDIDALAGLSLGGKSVPFRYDSLDPIVSCHRNVLKAYLKAKLDFFYLRPGGKSFREFLEKTDKLNLDTHPDIYKNSLGEYSVSLKVRFAQNHVDGAWDITDMLDDLDRVYSFSKTEGGPDHC